MTLQSMRCLLIGAIILVLATGCATSGSTTNQVLQHSDYRNAQFSNVLVIAVAANYEARAQFERQVVGGIRATGASATDDEKKVWAIESTNSNYTEVAQLIDAEVRTLVGRLKKDRMVGP